MEIQIKGRIEGLKYYEDNEKIYLAQIIIDGKTIIVFPSFDYMNLDFLPKNIARETDEKMIELKYYEVGGWLCTTEAQLYCAVKSYVLQS